MYNLGSNMADRIRFDEMVERTITEAEEAYGKPLGVWSLYINLDGMVSDEDVPEAIARIESQWPDDDDTPAMPTLEDALARLAMESPEAARAARNFLEGTSELRTVWVRFRVSERERTAIEDGMRAAGVEKISEYCRGKVLG